MGVGRTHNIPFCRALAQMIDAAFDNDLTTGNLRHSHVT